MKTTESLEKKSTLTSCGVVALVLSVMLLMTCLTGTPVQLKNALIVSASDQESSIDGACQAYKTEYGTLPPTSENYRLEQILCGDNPRKIEFLTLRPSDLTPNGDMIDPWKTPFRITFDSNSKVHVISAGPDKIFGTPDDITNQ